jgi:hypothetical protein
VKAVLEEASLKMGTDLSPKRSGLFQYVTMGKVDNVWEFEHYIRFATTFSAFMRK